MQTTRNHALDMAKVFATCFILFHHYQMVGVMVTGQTMPGPSFYSSAVQPEDFSWGYVVELFFLISGFVMLPYLQKIRQGLTFYQFYTRRAARLLPLLALSGAVCAAVLVVYDKAYQTSFWAGDPSLFGVVLHALGIQAGWGFADPYLNSATWYCSVLLLCCLLFFAVVYWSGRLGVSPFYGLVFLVFLGCAGQTFHTQLPLLDNGASRGYSAFFAGVVLAALWPLLQKWRGTPWVCLVLLAAAGAELYKNGGRMPYMPFPLTFLVYPALLFLLQQPPCSAVSRLPLWEGLARISYSVYLWHIPFYILLYSIAKLLGQDPAVLVCLPGMLLSAAALWGIGWVSYRCLERPLNQKALAWLAALDPARQPEHV